MCLPFSDRWVWFSRQALTLVSFTSCTTSMTVTTCPACRSAPSHRAPIRWTATYHVPLRRRSSPSSWWSPPLSASWCASARWFTSSANAFRNWSRGRLRQTGGCLPKVTRWRHWQRPDRSSDPKHQSEWILLPPSKTSITSRRRMGHHQKNKLQYGRSHVKKLT